MFSETVLAVIAETKRTDKQDQIVRYVRQTLKECTVLAYFHKDMTEDTLTTDASPYVWNTPQRLRLLRTVYYAASNLWPRNLPPGKIQERQDHFYYGGPGYFTFKGVTAADSINVSYYSYPRQFKYYSDLSLAPAAYDPETETWTYHTDYTGTTALNEEAEALVSNWLLIEWPELIRSGTITKLYNGLEDPRGRIEFSQYKNQQKDLIAGEVFESLDY